MNPIWNSIIIAIVTATLSVLGNFFFIKYYKRQIDESLEKMKVSYSGIYKEKAAIFKETLQRTYDIRYLLNYFHATYDVQKLSILKDKIDAYDGHNMVNQPYLNKYLFDTVCELQMAYNEIYIIIKNNHENAMQDRRFNEIQDSYQEEINKNSFDDLVFMKLELQLVYGMRKELGIEV